MIGCSGSRCWSHSPFQLSVEERATARGWGGPKLEMWLSPMSPHAGTAVLRGAGSISSTECVGATKLRKRGFSRANAAKIPGKRSLLALWFCGGTGSKVIRCRRYRAFCYRSGKCRNSSLFQPVLLQDGRDKRRQGGGRRAQRSDGLRGQGKI